MNVLLSEMSEGFKKLYRIIDKFGYSALEDMRKEVVLLLLTIENRQAKLRYDALNTETKRG